MPTNGSTKRTRRMNFSQKEKESYRLGTKLMSTSDIAAELGFQISAQKIKDLGLEPVVTTSNGYFWQASSFPVICMKLSANISELGVDFIHDKKFKLDSTDV